MLLYLVLLFSLGNAFHLKMEVTPQSVFKNRFLYRQEPLSILVDEIQNKDVNQVIFSSNLDTVVSKNKEINDNEVYDYSTTKINPYISNYLVETSVKNKVETIFLQPEPPNLLQSIAGSTFQIATQFILPYIILISIVSALRMNSTRNGGPGGPSMFNNNPFSMNSINKNIQDDKEAMQKANVTLSSFAGSPEIFRECTEVVSYLKNETIYKDAGAEIPRGVLLEGPPGTGKTLLAKAIASEAEANFISIAGSEFVEVFVGVGASKVRELFNKARSNKPCIIFIDEIDAVGRQRGAGVNLSNDEREQTLNQLLAEMDGFGDNDGVLVIAATNRRDVLDNALLRPGRFDRIINVALPDMKSRRQILNVHKKNKQLEEDVNLDLVAELTSGFSGAQLKNLLNEAAIFAARAGKTIISNENLLAALDKVIVGIVKENDERSFDTKNRVAIHETGHAILALQFSEYFDLKKVSIQSTYNGAGGYTIFNEKKEIQEGGLYTKDLLIKRLAVAMGGKAAENIVYGDKQVSLGAVQDLKQANDLAKRMIGNFGMGDKLEVFYNEDVDSGNTPFLGRSLSSGGGYSEKTRELFDQEVNILVQEAYETAKSVLRENKGKMNDMIDALLKQQVLIPSDIDTLFPEISPETFNEPLGIVSKKL